MNNEREIFFSALRSVPMSQADFNLIACAVTAWVNAERKSIVNDFTDMITGEFTDHLEIPTADQAKQDIANVPAWNGANHLKHKAA